MNSTTVTTTEIRREFRNILNDLIRGNHVEVTNYAKPCAVIVSPEWYDQAATLMAQEAERTA